MTSGCNPAVIDPPRADLAARALDRLPAADRDALAAAGIGQAITVPLFFSSNALYPTAVMPGSLQAVSKVNPLSYEVAALRSLLVGTSTNLWLDLAVLAAATVAGITASSLLLPAGALALR